MVSAPLFRLDLPLTWSAPPREPRIAEAERPASTGAQLVAMLQVILGYIMLGGLLSILSNKMARRAD